ncbi:MAG: hypothetical protein H6Q70_448 [Firmicutes bacterium]|nr:hypothetical protein [Bacillota bacterium]
MQAIEPSSLETIVRTISVFLIVLLIARLLGRKQISQLTFFDYLAGTTIGSLAASAMTNKSIPFATDLICFMTWTILIIASHIITGHSAPAKKFLNDQPRVVIRSGKILESNLATGFYSASDLLAQLREKEIFDPNEVEIGILETTGQLSILKKAEYKTVTCKDLNLPKQTYINTKVSQYISKELILHGKILHENLSLLHISKAWLQEQLQLQGIDGIEEVTIAILTPEGKVYVDTKSDQ